jgi:enterochelin esterase-like enzyme
MLSHWLFDATTPRTTPATTSSITRRATPAPVWIDVGTEDPFHNAAVQYAHEIHAQLHVWPGGHDSDYWHSHMRQYLAFYARHCA